MYNIPGIYYIYFPSKCMYIPINIVILCFSAITHEEPNIETLCFGTESIVAYGEKCISFG